jgi:hypothetical protein
VRMEGVGISLLPWRYGGTTAGWCSYLGHSARCELRACIDHEYIDNENIDALRNNMRNLFKFLLTPKMFL